MILMHIIYEKDGENATVIIAIYNLTTHLNASMPSPTSEKYNDQMLQLDYIPVRDKYTYQALQPYTMSVSEVKVHSAHIAHSSYCPKKHTQERCKFYPIK